MDETLLQKVKKLGFDSLDDFVENNLHYLPKHKQELFHSVTKRHYD